MPFTYLVVSGAIAVGASQTINLQIEQDAIFELHHFLGRASTDAMNDPIPNNFSVTIKESATGKYFSNIAMPQALICGPANNSIREYRPIQLRPGTILEITLFNLNAAPSTVTFGLKGYKIFNL